MDLPVFDYQFRLILIGDSTVGKSSLLKFFSDGQYAGQCHPTVGVDFFMRMMEMIDGKYIKLKIWDTAGQERFRSITTAYYRNSVGVLLVYDITNYESFEHIPEWMMEAQQHIGPYRPVFGLVGCKLDLVKAGFYREVTTEEAQAFAKYHDMPFVETSAGNGANVEEAFRKVTEEIYRRVDSGEYKVHDGWDGIERGLVSIKSEVNVVPGQKSYCC